MLKTLCVYHCDICGEEFQPWTVGEYTANKVTSLRIDGWYKPEAQAQLKDICKSCSTEILKTVNKLKEKT